MMLNNSTRKRNPLAQKIRESKHPEIVADFYSSGVIEVLRRWVENDYNYTVEEVFETLNNVLETSLYCYDKKAISHKLRVRLLFVICVFNVYCLINHKNTISYD